jgi:fatty-acid desaturase
MKSLSPGAPAFFVVVCLPTPLALGVTYVYDLWWLLLASIIYAKLLAVVGVQIGLHRYFAHRSFATSKAKHILLCCASVLSGTRVTSWALTHLHHHRNSNTDRDLHSPHVDSFLQATVLWPLRSRDWFNSKNMAGISPNLLRDKYVMFIHTHYNSIWATLIILSLLISWKVCLFALLFPASFVTLNSLVMTNGFSHMELPGSYRNFDTPDKSTNNKWVQAFQIGEGLHNNHHKYPSRYSQAVESHERDPVAWIVEKLFIETDSNSKYKL